MAHHDTGTYVLRLFFVKGWTDQFSWCFPQSIPFIYIIYTSPPPKMAQEVVQVLSVKCFMFELIYVLTHENMVQINHLDQEIMLSTNGWSVRSKWCVHQSIHSLYTHTPSEMTQEVMLVLLVKWFMQKFISLLTQKYMVKKFKCPINSNGVLYVMKI